MKAKSRRRNVYPSGKSRALFIENQVSAKTSIETFMIKLENRVINQVLNYS